MSDRPIIVWFRRDLRLGDHPALDDDVPSGAPIVPVYVLDDDVAGVCPQPIIARDEGRRQALAAYEAVKSAGGS
jgi:deoxyribodipyrimidine photolyase